MAKMVFPSTQSNMLASTSVILVLLCYEESQRSIDAFDFLYFISHKGKIITVSDRSLTQINTTAHNIIHDAIQQDNISVSIHFKCICCIPPVINLYFGWLSYNSVVVK